MNYKEEIETLNKQEQIERIKELYAISVLAHNDEETQELEELANQYNITKEALGNASMNLHDKNISVYPKVEKNRDFVRYLKKYFQKHKMNISLNNFKNSLTEYICDVVKESVIYAKEDLFTYDFVENVIDCILDDLSDVFEKIIDSMMEVSDKFVVNGVAGESGTGATILLKKYIAMYVVDKNNEKDTLETLKTTMYEVFTRPEKELFEEVYAENKKERGIEDDMNTKKSDKQVIEELKEALDEMNVLDASILEAISYVENPKNFLKKFMETSEKYFKYDDEKEDNDRYMTRLLASIESNKNNTLIENICAFSKAFHCIYINENLDNGNDEEIFNFYTLYFSFETISYLAYLLVTDLEERDDIIEQFYDIYEHDDECQSTYKDIEELYTIVKKIDNLYGSMIITSEYEINHMMMAVLCNTQRKSIANKVKDILLGDVKDQDIVEMNKEEHQVYYEYEDENIMFTRDCAYTFMYNYYKDPRFLAPGSIFLELAGKYVQKLNILYNTPFEADTSEDTREEINEVLNDLIDYSIREARHENLLEMYCKDYKDAACFTKLNAFLDVEFAFDQLIEKYREELIYEIDEYGVKFFKELSMDEQLESIVILVFIRHIDERLNTKQQYNISSLVDHKKQEQLEQRNTELEATITSLQEQLTTIKANTRNEVHKAVKEQENKVKQDITRYQRELTVKDKEISKYQEEIKKLKEEHNELYKLRELMFAKQTIPQIKEEIDYSKEIKKKLKENKVVIIGGNTSIINSLKNKYNDLVFMGNQDAGVNNSSLVHADYAFIFYEWISHSNYYKAVDILNNNNITWEFVSGSNMNMIEKKMYEAIK